MNKEIEIPEGYEARIDGNKVILEPKESNDEKIRKSLVEFFRKFNPKHMWNEVFSFGDVLSYLEKQKDKRELDFAEGKVEGVKQTCQEIKDAMSLFEPKDLTPFELTFREYIDSAIRYCLSGEGYQQYIKEWASDLLNFKKQKEQKHAEWSEKDNAAHIRILGAVGKAFMGVLPTKPSEEDVHWLKTLPERFNLQSRTELSKEEKERIRQNGRLDVCYNPEKYGLYHKVEWSEEDKKTINNVVQLIEDGAFNLNKEEKDFYICRLKSLFIQPRTEWSEEDTYILEDAITAVDLLGNDNEYSKTHPNLAKAFRVAKDWLKTLPERFNLQPNQDWSEEDEHYFQNLIMAVDSTFSEGNTKNWSQNRFKLLRPKSH